MVLVKSNIGQRFLPYIKCRFETIQNQDVCGVYVHKADQKAFLNSEEQSHTILEKFSYNSERAKFK